AIRLVRIGGGQSIFYEVGASLLGGRVSLSNPGETLARERIAGTRAAHEAVRLESGAE
ncbi:hypothetical protein MNBD_PLANCTO03-2034, partial [hydrothermal vent metagenome]